ncbi:MAG TPA: glycosyltransferase family 4 protein [Methylomirabilota bacterium]|nr:glycosyltransferase family 4 protein [Methylomirabilota bacterium]
MNPLRILHLMSCRGWSSDAYWAGRAVRELREIGHHVTLVCQEGSEERVGRRLRLMGVDDFQTLDFGRGGIWSGWIALQAIRRLAESHELIHVHRGKEHWLAACANRLLTAPRPIVRTRHIVHPVRAHLANRWLYRRATDAVVAVTDGIRRAYLRSGLVLPDRIVTFYGGVDIDVFSPKLRGSLAAAGVDDRPVVGLVGGLRVMKGHRVMVGALARLKQKGFKFRALFVGQGSQEAVIRNEIVKNDLEEEIALAGFVPDLATAMRAFDVAVYAPLESEGMGRVVFEYLAMGKPLAATGVGVVPEILTDGQDALIVPPGDPDSLAQAISRLLSDRSLASRLGEAGRVLVESRYSGKCLARNLADLYHALLSDKPSAVSHQRSA